MSKCVNPEPNQIIKWLTALGTSLGVDYTTSLMAAYYTEKEVDGLTVAELGERFQSRLRASVIVKEVFGR